MGELALDHYELRSWRGWHHHMTLGILTHHFLVWLQHRLGPRSRAASRPPAPTLRLDQSMARATLTPIPLLLCTLLPQPMCDPAAVPALLRYQQRCKATAYRSHRKRTLRRFDELRHHKVSS